MPSTITFSPKKNTQANKRHRKTKQKSNYVDIDASSSQTDSDDTEKSSSSSSSSISKRKQPPQQRNRQYKKWTNTQQKSHFIPVDNMKSSTVGYAGPDFMTDAPSPSSLPLPTTIRPKTDKQQQPLDDSKSYLMDPISEIQEKLRMILKIQV